MITDFQKELLNKESPALHDVKLGDIIQQLQGQNVVTEIDGSEGKTACKTNGITAIVGGTGIADLTLAAPNVGDKATIFIDSRTSGDIVVTCADGVTFDGVNDIATFNAVGEMLILVYADSDEWKVVQNVGSVALSATPE